MVEANNRFEDVDYLREHYANPEDAKYDENNPDKFKDENMYKYHENTQVFNPIVQPYSFFYVTDVLKVYPLYIPDGDQIVSKTYMT